MKDLILISDYREYLEKLLDAINKQKAKTEFEFYEAKTKYENDIFRKIFGFKFEDSLSYFPKDRRSYYSSTFSAEKRNVEREIERLNYHEDALHMKKIEFNRERFDIEDFYKFSKSLGY